MLLIFAFDFFSFDFFALDFSHRTTEAFRRIINTPLIVYRALRQPTRHTNSSRARAPKSSCAREESFEQQQISCKTGAGSANIFNQTRLSFSLTGSEARKSHM